MPRWRDMEHARARVLPKELLALYEHLQENLEKEIPGLKVESDQVANEARQLTGEFPF